MKNNKRFLFPFACVCVLASQIIPLITYHKTLKLSSAATTKNSAVVPFLSPSRALLLSLLLWNDCSTNLLLKKKKNRNTNNITQNASPPPSCFANAPKNCHTRASKMRSKLILKKSCERDAQQLPKIRPNSRNTGTRLKVANARASERDEKTRQSAGAHSRSHFVFTRHSAGWKICDRKGHTTEPRVGIR